MVEVWEIRGWSLKVREEPLSTGSSQNESCYLILLSTLLRFIRQLFDAYNMLLTELGSSAAGVFSLPLSVFLPVCILLLSFSHFRLLNSIYISDNIYITYESIFLHLYNLDRYFLAINYFFKSLTFLQIASL